MSDQKNCATRPARDQGPEGFTASAFGSVNTRGRAEFDSDMARESDSSKALGAWGGLRGETRISKGMSQGQVSIPKEGGPDSQRS